MSIKKDINILIKSYEMGGGNMGNKKRTYTIVAILLAVVALGIGYAAVSTLLTIDGSATALASDGIKLSFTGTPTNSGTESGNSAAINGSDPTKATCTVVLKNVGDSATCTYTVTNSTTDTSIGAKHLAISVYVDSSFNTAWSESSSQYFTITSGIGATTLANPGSTTATVTVTLKKENTTNATMPETFYVKIVGETDQS